MFPIRKIVSKLKHMLKPRRVLNHFIFSVTFMLLLWLVWRWLTLSDPDVPKHLCKYMRFADGYVIPDQEMSDENVELLKLKIKNLNANAQVLNEREHGAVTADTTMIAIQVHKNAEQLQHLIISLAQAHLIQQVLLIFSHSYYDEGINELITSIDYCKVMQIFYPHSLQLHPNRFPGLDPADGFNRDARLSEQKQHWWWKAHFIFEGLNMTSPKRLVIFLEEDDFVLPDFLYILQHARRLLKFFPSAEVLALGRSYAEGLPYDALLLDSWTPVYDRGLAFNISLWRKITKKASYYCRYNDCSWSYSLAHLFRGFPNGVADVAASMAPRVVGTRGGRGGRGGLRWAAGLARAAPLFPKTLRAVVLVSPVGRVRHEAPPHAQGGWGDRRDHALCFDILQSHTTDAVSNGTSSFRLLTNDTYKQVHITIK